MFSKNDTQAFTRLDWQFPESNKAQDYVTHTLFRYFGKLPPTVTRRILEYGCVGSNEVVLDVMCGSGTTAVEAKLQGLDSVNIDINPLSALIGEVKTTVYDARELSRTMEEVISTFDAWRTTLKGENHPMTLFAGSVRDEPDALQAKVLSRIPRIPNIDYWFSTEAQQDLALMLLVIDCVASEEDEKFAQVCFASIIRKASNASSSAGRIFFDKDKKPKPVRDLFVEQVAGALSKVTAFAHAAQPSRARFVVADARSTGLESSRYGFIIFHPPYFALYRYSSDVLRFELEWLGLSRKEIARSEIEDGFKTTRLDLFDTYVNDIKDVLAEAYRVLKPERSLCLVNKDSTLRDEKLPVIKRLVEAAQDVGFEPTAVCDRAVIHTQATYHRSARDDKVTTQDSLVFFAKPAD